MSTRLVMPPSAAAFLARAEEWLLENEDRHNVMLGIAYALADGSGDGAGVDETDLFWGVIERGGEVVGCAVRTPPHKLLITELPTEAAPVLAAGVAERYADLPAVLGPDVPAEAVAAAWVALRGGRWTPGMRQGIYRLDRVEPPSGVAGSLREAGTDDLDLAMRWGGGFTRDAGIAFPKDMAAVTRWIEARALHVWEVGGAPTCIAVAQGRTPGGVRIGYVYTPPEHRRRGYAGACVAALSQKQLDLGLDFCVLYTDLANPTSNAVYRRVGYRLIEEVRDFDFAPEEER